MGFLIDNVFILLSLQEVQELGMWAGYPVVSSQQSCEIGTENNLHGHFKAKQRFGSDFSHYCNPAPRKPASAGRAQSFPHLISSLQLFSRELKRDKSFHSLFFSPLPSHDFLEIKWSFLSVVVIMNTEQESWWFCELTDFAHT